MNSQEGNKMVPLQVLQTYKQTLDDHHEIMAQFFKQHEKGYLPQAMIEAVVVKPLVELHTCLSTILEDNNLVSVDNTAEQLKIAGVMQSLLKVQNQLVTFNTGHTIGRLLGEVKVDITKAVGGCMSDEVTKLLDAFTANSESIESRFSQLTQRIDDLEQNVIGAIRQEKDKAVKEESQRAEKVIRELKQEIAAKDSLLKQQFDNLAEMKQQATCHTLSDTKDRDILEQRVKHLEEVNSQGNSQIAKLNSELIELQSELALAKNQVNQEEVKEYNPKSQFSSSQNDSWPCFEFFKNYQDIKFTDLQYKDSFNYSMVHPYSDDIFQIEAHLDICTVFKGVPYGPALIQYNDPDDEFLSFKGLGVFNDGQLHLTPLTFITERGWKYQIQMMRDGRPAPNSIATFFHENGYSQNVDSLKNEIDVSGCSYYQGQFDQQFERNGMGKGLLSNGNIFIGQYQNSLMSEGNLYELQSDSTYTQFMVKYDYENDSENDEVSGPSQQLPIEKILIRQGIKL